MKLQIIIVYCFSVFTVSKAFIPTNCTGLEIEPFDRIIQWEYGCQEACVRDCTNYTICGNADLQPASCPSTYSSCDYFGCQCLTGLSQAVSSISEAIVANVTCTSAVMKVSLSKCVLNALGFYIQNVYAGPPISMSWTFGESLPNECKGSLGFSAGLTYDFTVSLNKTLQCWTVPSMNDTHITFSNAIHGFSGTRAVISRSASFLINFSCSYLRNSNMTLPYYAASSCPSLLQEEIDGHCVNISYLSGVVSVKNLEYDTRLLNFSSPYAVNFTNSAIQLVTAFYTGLGMSVVEIVIYSYAPGSVVINYIAEVVANNLTTDEVMEELRIIASVVNNNTINETVYGDKLNVLKQFEFGEVSVHDADQEEIIKVKNPCNTGRHDCDEHADCIILPHRTDLPLPVSYTCRCHLGYHDAFSMNPGRLCQSLCHPSAGEFCQNGGTCVLDSSKNEAKCVCTTLYKGDRCEIVRENVITVLKSPTLLEQFMPWFAATVLIVVLIASIVIFIRRRRLFSQDVKEYLPEEGATGSEAMVGLIQYHDTIEGRQQLQ